MWDVLLFLLNLHYPVFNHKILNLKKSGNIPFLFIAIKNNGTRGGSMAKSHDSVKKRKKELARKEKKDQKRQRKLGKKAIKAENKPDPSNQN